jgi:hypothetical protein
MGIPIILFSAGLVPAGPNPDTFEWETVVNKNDKMPNAPPDAPPRSKTFNSFNQPSVNMSGVVVLRARSRGGMGQHTRGIYSRNMSNGDVPENSINTIAGGQMLVPFPNNLEATFIEFPSIPRIAIHANAVATRGNHSPVWEFIPPGETENTRAGTSGVYFHPNALSTGSALNTGSSKLGLVPEFSFFAVPGVPEGTIFDVFPGSPSITDFLFIAFKGNYTELVGSNLLSKTGVFYRGLVAEPAGGSSPVELIANTDTLIPNLPNGVTGITFGSTAPPSAAGDRMVFVGLDNEENPTVGGIYQAQLAQPPTLTTLVALGSKVPDEKGQTFTRLGEGLSYDGRFVAFWGAWGNDTNILWLDCPTEGNSERIQFCLEEVGDNFPVQVPLNQGIFVYDTFTTKLRMVARTGDDFDDFVFWNFSGRVPGSQEEDDGEPARWRSSSFVSVSGRSGATFSAVFKARNGEIDPTENFYVDPIDGIYLNKGPGQVKGVTVLDTTMFGNTLDPEASPGSLITALGLEREGLRGKWLVINASMGEEGAEEDASMAGIYLTEIP